MPPPRSRACHPAVLVAAVAALLLPAMEAQAQSQPSSSALAASPVIDGIEINADDALLPGSTLDIAVRGTPHGRASVLLPGGDAPLGLRETEPGRYAGRYTVRPADRIDANGAIRASVARGTRSTTASYRFPPSFRVGDMAVAKPSAPTEPAPVRAAAAPEPTRTMGAAAATTAAPLVLQVTSPSGTVAVDPGNGLVVEGRTAPNAMVRARIDAVPPAAPGRASVARIVMEETIQADAEGRFRISIGPQRDAPGTLFEIGLRASQGGQNTPEQRLVVTQGQAQG